MAQDKRYIDILNRFSTQVEDIKKAVAELQQLHEEYIANIRNSFSVGK